MHSCLVKNLHPGPSSSSLLLQQSVSVFTRLFVVIIDLIRQRYRPTYFDPFDSSNVFLLLIPPLHSCVCSSHSLCHQCIVCVRGLNAAV